MNKPHTIIILLLVTIIGLTLARVVVANRLSTTGIELDEINRKLAMYHRENALLQEAYLQKASLMSIAQAAQRQGYVVAGKEASLVMTYPLPLAYSR